MINCGEEHTGESLKELTESLAIVNNMEVSEEEPDTWIYESSSGYPGYRCKVCCTWVYASATRECDCDNSSPTKIKERLEQSETLTDFMEMIEEYGAIQFDKPKLINDFRKRK